MEFVHWSPGEIKEFINKKNAKKNYKPIGLYFARGLDWINWCNSAGFWPHIYTTEYKVRNLDKLNIFTITPENEKEFRRKYLLKDVDMMYGPNWLDWMKVKKDYDGVVIDERLIRPSCLGNMSSMLWSDYDVGSLILWSGDVELVKVRQMKFEDVKALTPTSTLALTVEKH
jgi:hypothetical protein